MSFVERYVNQPKSVVRPAPQTYLVSAQQHTATYRPAVQSKYIYVGFYNTQHFMHVKIAQKFLE